MKTLGIVLTPGVGVTQAAEMNFGSVCRLTDNRVIGVNENGAYLIDSGDLDDTDVIDAFLEFVTTDFGLANQKRVRKAIVGTEGYGECIITVTFDEGSSIQRNFDLDIDSGKEEGIVIAIGREYKGRYVKVRIDNFAGSDFSLDAIDLMLSILSKKAGRIRFFGAYLSEYLPALTCTGND
jgi:hypothetical protein